MVVREVVVVGLGVLMQLSPSYAKALYTTQFIILQLVLYAYKANVVI